MIVDNGIQILNGSKVKTEANIGGGGNINLSTDQSLYLSDSTITTSVVRERPSNMSVTSDIRLRTATVGDGTAGGNITIISPFTVLDRSAIEANNEISKYFLISRRLKKDQGTNTA